MGMVRIRPPKRHYPLSMRRGAVIYLVALVVACVGAVAVGIAVADRIDKRADPPRAVSTTVVVRPPPGQLVVRGRLDALAADDVQAPPIGSPFTITALTRGEGKATIENALVDGKRTTIFWGGGTPLPISGGGGLEIAGARVDINSSGAKWSPAGAARPFLPGTYQIGAPVAVGEEGLSRPRESVAFEADARTVLNATEGVVIEIPPSRLQLEGPGRVAITGSLKVVESTGERDAGKVELTGGPYKVDIKPAGSGGLDIDATIQGPYKVT